MKLNSKNSSWVHPALASVALVCAATLGQAQTAQDYIVSQFDDGSVQGWAYNFGGAHCTLEFDAAMDRGPGASPGAMKVTIPFNLCTLGGDNQSDWEKTLAASLDLTKYTKLHWSVYVDPSSARLSDWGGGQLGPQRPHVRLSSWGGDVSLAVSSADSTWVGTDYGAWHDYSIDIDQIDAAKQPTRIAAGVLGMQMWSGWGSCAAPIGLTNTVTFWIDNIWFEANTNPVPAAPPKMTLSKAGTPGVLIAMGTAGGQWDRQAISTPAPNGSYIWTKQGGYPVSYSCTITSFPPVNTHQGYEAHIYIGNADTGPANIDTSGSPDWGCPDIFIFRIENVKNTLYTTNGADITTNFTYNAMAQIQWKTNFPNNNATNIPVIVYPPNALGTWTVTFDDATHGSLSGPGITNTNFTLPDDAVTNNFSPTASFVQFGNFKNDGANDGHNDDATGTFSHVAIAGTAAPIDDNFSGSTLTNNYAWRKTDANRVQYIAKGTAWFLSWTLPAIEFSPQVAAAIEGPWNLLTLAPYQNGTNMIAPVPSSAIPAGKSAFFNMIKRVATQVQVLAPGESNAPGTTSGKTGTPTSQVAYNPITITVNAVDNTWHIVPSVTDTITLVCSDPNASYGSGGGQSSVTATMVNGVATFTGDNAIFATPGDWTFTATSSDTNKPPATSSSVHYQ